MTDPRTSPIPDVIRRRRQALLSLLADDDPATVALVKEQLVALGPDELPELQELSMEADPAAAPHVRELIETIHTREAGARFMDICRQFGEHGEIESSSWNLAAALMPGTNFLDHYVQLDAWGKEVKRRLHKAHSPLDRVETLAEFLNIEQRLRGNDDDYYNLRNSLLPAVVESRLGIPITLSLVYMLVARRAGMRVDGIGLPGHFIVRHEDIFFDPFHGGRRVSLDECKSLLLQQNLVLLPQHLAPATPRQMLVRLLTNIYYIAEQTNPQLAAQVSEWISAIRKS